MTRTAALRLGAAIAVALLALLAAPAFAKRPRLAAVPEHAATLAQRPHPAALGERAAALAGEEDSGAAVEDGGSGDDQTATDDPANDDESTDDGTDDPAGDACGDGDVATPFERWHDGGDYALVADFEDDLSDWTLDGGARAADGNEPFTVSDPEDGSSLLLPAGASATSPPLCLADPPTFARFFARAGKHARLRVEAVVVDSDRTRRLATLPGTRRGWKPTRRIALPAGGQGDATHVVLRFTAVRGSWRVDDLYASGAGGA